MPSLDDCIASDNHFTHIVVRADTFVQGFQRHVALHLECGRIQTIEVICSAGEVKCAVSVDGDLAIVEPQAAESCSAAENVNAIGGDGQFGALFRRDDTIVGVRRCCVVDGRIIQRQRLGAGNVSNRLCSTADVLTADKDGR